MKDYLFHSDNTLIHYFYKPGRGLWRKCGSLTARQIYPNRLKAFSVSKSQGGEEEILCNNEKNELIYINPSRSQIHTIAHIADGIEIIKLQLFEFSGKLHFLYSAKYKGEFLLVYSPLDNNALPKTPAKLQTPEFFLYKSAVYFTLQNGVLGYIDLSRNDFLFNRLTDNAHDVYLFLHNSADCITYKKGDDICFQNRPICHEPLAEMPILFTEHDTLYIMWKSNGFVKYRKSTDSGKSWSNTMRIITAAHEAELTIFNGKELRYAEKIGNNIRLLGQYCQLNTTL